MRTFSELPDCPENSAALAGTLYIIGTPIGNLEDITLRALHILQTVDWIGAEDTRHSGRLLHYFGISKPMLSYFEHNKKSHGSKVLALLQEGKSLGLITDAGMPGISDPGADLIKDCIRLQIPVVVVPGPCALITGLVASGLDTSGFVFGGFLPRETKPRKTWLAQYGSYGQTVIFYESPHRLLDTLRLLQEIWGDRCCCVARELTKRYEEFCRGSLSQVVATLGARAGGVKGEIVVVVAGALEPASPTGPWQAAEIRALCQEGLNQGLSTKEISRLTADKTGWSKRDIYNLLIQEEN